jgi:hypothetical protein
MTCKNKKFKNKFNKSNKFKIFKKKRKLMNKILNNKKFQFNKAVNFIIIK